MFDYYQEFATKQHPQFLMSESGYLNEKYLKAVKIAPFNQLVINNKYKEYESNVIWNKIYRANLIKENNCLFDPKARKGQHLTRRQRPDHARDPHIPFHKRLSCENDFLERDDTGKGGVLHQRDDLV